MPDISTNEIEDVANEILKHLYKNPQKKDSLRGIYDSWILGQQLDFNINKIVTTAINLLLSKKLIIERDLLGRGKIYMINKLKRPEILRIITLPIDSLERILN